MFRAGDTIEATEAVRDVEGRNPLEAGQRATVQAVSQSGAWIQLNGNDNWIRASAFRLIARPADPMFEARPAQVHLRAVEAGGCAPPIIVEEPVVRLVSSRPRLEPSMFGGQAFTAPPKLCIDCAHRPIAFVRREPGAVACDLNPDLGPIEARDTCKGEFWTLGR